MTRIVNPVSFIRSHLGGFRPLKQSVGLVQEEIWRACQDLDAIVFHPIG